MKNKKHTEQRVRQVGFMSGSWRMKASVGYSTPAFWLGRDPNFVSQQTTHSRLYIHQEGEGVAMSARFSKFPRSPSMSPYAAYDLTVDRFRLWGKESLDFALGLHNLAFISDPVWMSPFNRETSNASVYLDLQKVGSLSELKIGCSYALSMAIVEPSGASRPYQYTDGKREEQPRLHGILDELLKLGVPSHG